MEENMFALNRQENDSEDHFHGEGKTFGIENGLQLSNVPSDCHYNNTDDNHCNNNNTDDDDVNNDYDNNDNTDIDDDVLTDDFDQFDNNSNQSPMQVYLKNTKKDISTITTKSSQNLSYDKQDFLHEFHSKKCDNHLAYSNTDKGNVAKEQPLETQCSNTSQSSELDSIHVKDIWKALNESGFDITREEVSKYKSNTSKSSRRIRSAPPRRDLHSVSLSRNIARVRSARNVNDNRISGDSLLSRSSTDSQEKDSNDRDDEKYVKVNPKARMAQDNLEVIAVSKPVSQLPRQVKLLSPLYFKINTRPKPSHFFYFAYGLNLNQKRLDILLRCKTGVKYWALLFGFRLLFNKRGSSDGDVGFPNIVADSNFSVEGCVYELSQDCLPLLDTCVGFPKHYTRLVLPVWICNSQNPIEHGVAQHCVPSVVYIAQDEWVVHDPATLDCSFTLKQCLLATDILTPSYQEFFTSFMK